jgi:two-component system OmpR family response regulator
MIKVLMIEDDIELAQILVEYLASKDIEVDTYEDAFMALSALSLDSYELVILDLSLDGIDGLDVCKKIRDESNIPILISSARSRIQDKIEALSLGADDYLPKPYDPRELEARILSHTRRYRGFGDKKEVFRLDKRAMSLYKYDKEIRLTSAEYEIVEYLMSALGAVVSREDILDSVPSLSNNENNNSLSVIIGRIRSKIEDDVKKPKHLVTVRGMGYKFI